jgi:hypothetical protein
MRDVKPEGAELRQVIEKWADENADRVREAYSKVQPFGIENDRLAELLMPLQAVLLVVDKDLLPLLEEYANQLDGAENNRMTTGAQLLNACREILTERKDPFIGTEALLQELYARTDEPWGTWSHGNPMSARSLSDILKPFGIEPTRKQQKFKGKNIGERGYSRTSFEQAWGRYLPARPPH